MYAIAKAFAVKYDWVVYCNSDHVVLVHREPGLVGMNGLLQKSLRPCSPCLYCMAPIDKYAFITIIVKDRLSHCEKDLHNSRFLSDGDTFFRVSH